MCLSCTAVVLILVQTVHVCMCVTHHSISVFTLVTKLSLFNEEFCKGSLRPSLISSHVILLV